MKKNLPVSVGLHRQLKAQAQKEGRLLSAVVEQLLKEALASKSKQAVA